MTQTVVEITEVQPSPKVPTAPPFTPATVKMEPTTNKEDKVKFLKNLTTVILHQHHVHALSVQCAGGWEPCLLRVRLYHQRG